MKLVVLVGFIIKKFVTMHGHMNVKNALGFFIVILDKSSSDIFVVHFCIVTVTTEAFILYDGISFPVPCCCKSVFSVISLMSRLFPPHDHL